MSVTAKGCVVGWPGRRDKDGYPITQVGGKYRLVARLLYELFVGPVPPGMCVRHSCDNRECVNHAHIEVGTHADNIADKVRRGRQASGAQWHATRYPDDVIHSIQTDPDRFSVSASHALWGISKSQYYRIRNGESR